MAYANHFPPSWSAEPLAMVDAGSLRQALLCWVAHEGRGDQHAQVLQGGGCAWMLFRRAVVQRAKLQCLTAFFR